MPDKPIDRVPNLPNGRITDENGYPSPEESLWRQTTFSFMQNNLGSEGLVAPTQTAADILVIQNNMNVNPATGASDIPSCQFGTILYNSTANTMMMAVDDGSGNPLFKTVTLV